MADHVKHLITVGGEDCVGFGGDLDGVDSLPEGIEGVADYAQVHRSAQGSGTLRRRKWTRYATAT